MCIFYKVGGKSIVIFVIGSRGRIVAKTHGSRRSSMGVPSRGRLAGDPININAFTAACRVCIGGGVFRRHKRKSSACGKKLTAKNIRGKREIDECFTCYYNNNIYIILYSISLDSCSALLLITIIIIYRSRNNRSRAPIDGRNNIITIREKIIENSILIRQNLQWPRNLTTAVQNITPYIIL
jgi:hypothetical protein